MIYLTFENAKEWRRKSERDGNGYMFVCTSSYIANCLPRLLGQLLPEYFLRVCVNSFTRPSAKALSTASRLLSSLIAFTSRRKRNERGRRGAVAPTCPGLLRGELYGYFARRKCSFFVVAGGEKWSTVDAFHLFELWIFFFLHGQLLPTLLSTFLSVPPCIYRSIGRYIGTCGYLPFSSHTFGE